MTSCKETCIKCSDPTYSTFVHFCFQYISLLCTRYPPELCYRPLGHVPTLETALELMFLTYLSIGITLPIVPSLQTLVPTAWHAPDTDPDGLYSLPEPSGPCVLPSSYLYIDLRHISAYVVVLRPILCLVPSTVPGYGTCSPPTYQTPDLSPDAPTAPSGPI